MPDFPSWSYVTCASDTWMSAGWATDVMVQLSLAQQRLKNAMYKFSTLASFLAVAQNSQGAISAMYHSQIGGVLGSSHHNWYHGSTHRAGGSDGGYTVASDAANGLMPSTLFSRVNAMDATSSKNNFKTTQYTGNGTGASQTVTLGWQPQFVKVIQAGSIGVGYEWIWNGKNVQKHLFGSYYAHSLAIATNVIATQASGFQVRSLLNISNVVYHYWVAREG